jgi:hypothetical protein
LEVVEVWSGVEAVARVASRKGFRVQAFDFVRSPSEDITAEAGFHTALTYVLRLRQGGLLGLAPVCSSFIFPNSCNTKRTLDNVEGDTSYEPVRIGNLMAQVAALFLAIAVARGARCFLENPAGSMMFRYLESTLRHFPFLVAGCD